MDCGALLCNIGATRGIQVWDLGQYKHGWHGSTPAILSVWEAEWKDCGVVRPSQGFLSVCLVLIHLFNQSVNFFESIKSHRIDLNK